MNEIEALLKTLELESEKSFTAAGKEQARAEALAYAAIKLRTTIAKSKQEVK